jgi:hypothetical protein
VNGAATNGTQLEGEKKKKKKDKKRKASALEGEGDAAADKPSAEQAEQAAEQVQVEALQAAPVTANGAQNGIADPTTIEDERAPKKLKKDKAGTGKLPKAARKAVADGNLAEVSSRLGDEFSLLDFVGELVKKAAEATPAEDVRTAFLQRAKVVKQGDGAEWRLKF